MPLLWKDTEIFTIQHLTRDLFLVCHGSQTHDFECNCNCPPPSATTITTSTSADWTLPFHLCASVHRPPFFDLPLLFSPRLLHILPFLSSTKYLLAPDYRPR